MKTGSGVDTCNLLEEQMALCLCTSSTEKNEHAVIVQCPGISSTSNMDAAPYTAPRITSGCIKKQHNTGKWPPPPPPFWLVRLSRGLSTDPCFGSRDGLELSGVAAGGGRWGGWCCSGICLLAQIYSNTANARAFHRPIKVSFPGNLVNPEVNLILIITDYNL